MDISDDLRHALRNLSRKNAGAEVAFINISDARQLTELGLATRTRQGWDITPAGMLALNGMPEPIGDEESSVTPFQSSSRSEDVED